MIRGIKPQQIQAGDHITFLPDTSKSFYEVMEAPDIDGEAVVRFHSSRGEVFQPERYVFDDLPSQATVLNRYPSTNTKEQISIPDPVNTEANFAKLEVAAEYGLKAKFNYTNEQGRTHDVRLEPEETFSDRGVEYVAGLTDEGDYKQYRLDRINGKVAVR